MLLKCLVTLVSKRMPAILLSCQNRMHYPASCLVAIYSIISRMVRSSPCDDSFQKGYLVLIQVQQCLLLGFSSKVCFSIATSLFTIHTLLSLHACIIFSRMPFYDCIIAISHMSFTKHIKSAYIGGLYPASLQLTSEAYQWRKGSQPWLTLSETVLFKCEPLLLMCWTAWDSF